MSARPSPSAFRPALSLLALLLVASSALALGAGSEPPATEGSDGFDVRALDAMKSLPGGLAPTKPVVEPADNPSTPAKIELGRRLFFDTNLSGDRSMSCGSCHNPALGYADAKPRAHGFKGKELRRHTPTVLNAALFEPQFWDGRAQGLEAQAKGPLLSPDEMNLAGASEVEARLRESRDYRHRFHDVFGTEPTLEDAARAIAAYERTLVLGTTRFDRYASGDKAALGEAEKRGLLVFVGKANCTACHSGANFADGKFHSLGIPAHNPAVIDEGRIAVTGDPADRAAFKTPTLRGLAYTAPYMHDGSLATLEEVVDYYDHGGGDGPNKSKLVFELGLTPQEKSDLVEFLVSLSGPLPADATRKIPKQR